MYLNVENNIITDSFVESFGMNTEEINNLKRHEFSETFTSHMNLCASSREKLQPNLDMFDYLVKTRNYWENQDDLKKLTKSIKNKLLEYKNHASIIFPSDKYLKLLGYCCYKTESSRLCKHRAVNGICKLHKKFDDELKLNVTDNTPLIKDLQDIIISYIR